jgi:predicted ATP-dependent Lon-type protease
MMMQTELKQEIRELQRKNRELESNTNSQTVRTLKALFSKLLEALFTNNVTDLEEATRVILKILDYSTQEREDVHDNFEKRKKKKKGFFDIFK